MFATDNFLAHGGDDCRAFRAGEVLVDSASGSPMAGQLIDHIISAGSVAPKIDGRITREDWGIPHVARGDCGPAGFPPRSRPPDVRTTSLQ